MPISGILVYRALHRLILKLSPVEYKYLAPIGTSAMARLSHPLTMILVFLALVSFTLGTSTCNLPADQCLAEHRNLTTRSTQYLTDCYNTPEEPDWSYDCASKCRVNSPNYNMHACIFLCKRFVDYGANCEQTSPASPVLTPAVPAANSTPPTTPMAAAEITSGSLQNCVNGGGLRKLGIACCVLLSIVIVLQLAKFVDDSRRFNELRRVMLQLASKETLSMTTYDVSIEEEGNAAGP